jgi:hypothetical protein
VTQTVQRLTSTGTPVTDAREGRVTPRINLNAASQGCYYQVSSGSMIQAASTTSLAVT